MNIFECAIDRVHAAHTRYTELAAASMTQDRQELFTLLAAAESEHLQRLQELKRKTSRSDGAMSLDSCPRYALPQQGNIETDSYLDVTRAETASIAFYDDLATAAKAPEMRRLARQLAADERGHLQQIGQIYDFVERPRTFLAWGEFGNLREY